MKEEKHHILFPRKLWNMYESGHKLRTNNGLIVPLNHAAHLIIHGELEQVPLMDTYTLDRVVKLYIPRYDSGLNTSTDYIGNIRRLQDTVEEAIDHPRTSKIARSVGLTAIEALDFQINVINKTETIYRV